MKRFPHLQADRAAVREGDETDSWLSSVLSSPRPEFEETESVPSSAPVSPSIVKRRSFPSAHTSQTHPKAAGVDLGRTYSTAAPRIQTTKPFEGEHQRLPDTWQGIVEAAARDAAMEKVRLTRSSSLPDAAAFSWDGGKQGRAARTVRFSSGGREEIRGRGRDGIRVSAAEPNLGSAYHQLFAKRGRSPSAVQPTKARVHFSSDSGRA